MKKSAWVLVGILACSSFVQAQEMALSKWVKNFNKKLTSETLALSQCKSEFESRNLQMLAINYSKINRVDLELNGGKIARESYLARLNLRKLIRKWEQRQNPIGNECMSEVRRTLRVLRYLEETVATRKVNPAPYNAEAPATYLGEKNLYLQKSPGYEKLKFPADLQSGDLLISRGNAPTSALIARLGDDDGQFSHMALVYVNPVTQKPIIMEAHIEIGSTVRSFEEYANDKNFRVSVYRYKDAAVAAAAAKSMYDRLSKGSVPYDFHMDDTDESELFCSEIGYHAYRSQNVNVGKYRTTFKQMQNPDILTKLEVSVKEMFAPSDMEVEPDFELLAEWKDLSRVYENQRMDAILTKFLEWENEGYRLDPTPFMKIKSSIAYALRHDEYLHPLVDKKLPLNMTKTAIMVVMALDEVVGELADYLREVNSSVEKRTKDPLTFKEMFERLEYYRNGKTDKDTRLFNKLYHP